MKTFGYALGLAMAVASVGAAGAADLPTKKEVPAPLKPNCFASFWTWLDSSASDCPLSAGPFTLYGTADMGVGYFAHGADRSPLTDKPAYALQKYSNSSRWQGVYNGMSTSVLGIKMKQGLGFLGAPGWSLIGVLEAGINPYSGMFDNGPRSLADNNPAFANKSPFQGTNLDSSRAGQWDNSQGYIGISNNVYGTLTFGRTNSLALNAISAYDPVGATAFSLLAVSSSFVGFGNTETVRPNTAITYRLTYQNFRAAFQAQVGGYGLGNATNGMYQGQVGADFPLFGGTPYAGKFSFDAIGSWAKDAVSLSSFAGSNVVCLTPANCFINVNDQYFGSDSVVKATLSNNIGLQLMGRYKWNQFGFYGGYIYARLMNPSDDHLDGFETIASGIFVPGGVINGKGVLTNSAITVNSYNIQKVLMTWWGGAKWAVRPDLDLGFGYYFQSQNNFNTILCTGSGITISSNKCSGGQQGIGLVVDWRPVKRVDVYAGVMRNSVFGGLANGFNHQVNWDPAAGIRVRF